MSLYDLFLKKHKEINQKNTEVLNAKAAFNKTKVAELKAIEKTKETMLNAISYNAEAGFTETYFNSYNRETFPLIEKHPKLFQEYFESLGYETSFNSNEKIFIIKWGNTESLFNKEMKEVINE